MTNKEIVEKKLKENQDPEVMIGLYYEDAKALQDAIRFYLWDIRQWMNKERVDEITFLLNGVLDSLEVEINP